MEWFVQLCAVGLALLLAAIKSVQYKPGQVSEFELQRRIASGDAYAQAEHDRRLLLPTLIVIKNLQLIVIAVLLATLLFSTHYWALGMAYMLLYALLAYGLSAYGQFAARVRALQSKYEYKLWPLAAKAASVLTFLAPDTVAARLEASSRDELKSMLTHSGHLLHEPDKTHVLAAFDASTLKVQDAMVPAGRIATVGHTETVGPLLLDRLHKSGHKIFVVTDGDSLEDVKGLLYMSDVVNPHPDLVTVQDAVRPTVHYVYDDTPLSDVLTASLQTGRQLFLVCSRQGHIVGLVTLADALKKLTGYALDGSKPVARTQV